MKCPEDIVSYKVICGKFPDSQVRFYTYDLALKWAKMEQPANRPYYIVKCVEKFEIVDAVFADRRTDECNKAVSRANVDCMLKDLPPAQPEPQWIPCKNRLPKEEKASYWVCTDAGYQFECRWTNVNHLFTNLTMKWHWHVMDVPQYSTVVAWMPLPEPYGGEQE